MLLYGIILAGGSGTRLWPLSTAEAPKQFLKLFSEYSMIVETSNRIAHQIPRERQYILTGEMYSEIVWEQFGDAVHVLVEPEARNTAPCILWAALKIQKMGGGIMAVLPSDHLIKEAAQFGEALNTAKEAAEEGKIVTFGIFPERAETGYGYIEISREPYELNRSVKNILAFQEKPDHTTAEKYLEAGNFLWNSGMFVFRSDVMIEEFRKYCPDIFECFQDIDADCQNDVKKAFEQCRAVSIDYAVMEKTQRGYCIPASFGWNDVGSYYSLYQESQKDDDGNAGNALAINARNCYVNTRKKAVIVGVEDIIVAEGEDAILVADFKKSPEIGCISKKFYENQ